MQTEELVSKRIKIWKSILQHSKVNNKECSKDFINSNKETEDNITSRSNINNNSTHRNKVTSKDNSIKVIVIMHLETDQENVGIVEQQGTLVEIVLTRRIKMHPDRNAAKELTEITSAVNVAIEAIMNQHAGINWKMHI